MKKIISLTLALLILFTTTQMCLAVEPAKKPTSYDLEGTIKFNLDVSGTDIDDGTNSVLELFKDVNINYRGTSIQKNELAMQAYLETDITAGLYYIPLKLWLDLDMAEADNLTYKIIIEMPEALHSLIGEDSPITGKQYLLIDYGKMFKSAQMSAFPFNSINSMPKSQAAILEWANALLPELTSLINIETLSENHYKMVLSDELVKDLLIKSFDSYLGLITDKSFLEELFAELGEPYVLGADELAEIGDITDSIKAELPKIYGIIRNVEIFPGEGIVYEYKLNADGYTTYEKANVPIKIDIADWTKKIISAYPSLDEDVPEVDVVISAVIGYEADYKNINTAGPITFPILTDANSIDVFGMFLPSYEVPYLYEPVKVYVDDEYVIFPDAQPIIINNFAIVPAQAMFNSLDGVLEYEEADGIQIIKGTLGADSVKFIIGSSTAYINDEPIELDIAAYINNENRTMIPLSFIADNFDLTVEELDNEYADNCDLLVLIYSSK